MYTLEYEPTAERASFKILDNGQYIGKAFTHGVHWHFGTSEDQRRKICQIGLSTYPILKGVEFLHVMRRYQQMDEDGNIHASVGDFDFWLLYAESEDIIEQNEIMLNSLQLINELFDKTPNTSFDILRREFKTRLKLCTAALKDKRSRAGFVYVLEAPDADNQKVFKVGRTVNPEDRQRTFEVKLPYPDVNFLTVYQVPDMYFAEKYLHNLFSDRRINGEWFRLTPLDIERLIFYQDVA